LGPPVEPVERGMAGKARFIEETEPSRWPAESFLHLLNHLRERLRGLGTIEPKVARISATSSGGV
jgi:hypothetical protein